MANPNAFVVGVLNIPPSDPSLLRTNAPITVVFGNGQEARLDPSDAVSATYLDNLKDLYRHKHPAYVDIDHPETRFIRRVSAPLSVTVRDVIQQYDGNYRVRLETSAAVHTLRKTTRISTSFSCC